ncbi:hypothetical protein [Paracoccus lutimaris]|uniref:Ig-like domain-containing protein n=1 Tax=Paracoccus lutimaris TaxID=1490030 RepID=A0A368YV30_9RHOB|nr:hypothetical protein [Paracoccus lutimaris]RCW84070.1 hypothetical protein DFP89_10813 [Paracoccus lutimaris]
MPISIHGGIGRTVFDGIARIYSGGELVALMDAAGGTLIAREVTATAPVIIQQPTILPAEAALGDTVTLNLGLAEAHPVAGATWDITHDGVSIAATLDDGTMALTLSAPGTYVLTVSWSNDAGTATAEAVTLTVAAALPDAAPAIVTQPTIVPAGAAIGDTVTLDLGAAQGRPVPDANWDITRDGLSIKGSVDPEAMTLSLAGPGTYRLSVDWSNRAGSAAAVAATLTAAEEQPGDTAPSITRQPAILPATAVIGDSITLDLGAAAGQPTPAPSWDFTRDGVSIRSSLDQGALTMELSGAGVYVLTVSWANSAGSVTAQSATLTVQAPPTGPAVNYDTQTLAYFDAATSFTGSATDVTAVTARGTGGYVFHKEGSGAAIQRSASGFVFGNGCYLQSQTLTGQPMTDGLFAVVDCTLTSYGTTVGQILEGAGGHVKLRDNAGRLQVVGQDDSAVGIILGSVFYGSRVIVAGLLDDVLNLVGGINVAGGDVSAAHAGITDPDLTRVLTGRYVNGTIHRLAIVGRAEGQAWPVTMREVYEDFQQGE